MAPPRKRPTKPRQRDKAPKVRESLIKAIAEIESYADAVAVAQRYRRLLANEAVRKELGKMAQDSSFGHLAAPFLEMLDKSGDELPGTNADFDKAMSARSAGLAKLPDLIGHLDAALDVGDNETVISEAPAAISAAQALGLGLAVGHVRVLLGRALFRRGGESRAQDLDDAIAELDEGLRLTKPESQPYVAMDLALAWTERVNGDSHHNQLEAARIMRLALQRNSALDPSFKAMLQTNLAVILLRLDGDRPTLLREAKRHCDAALRYRSPARDIHDWTYSQLNLADVTAQLARLGLATHAEAASHYERLLAEAHSLADSWMIAAAHLAVGRFHLKRAQETPGEKAQKMHEQFEAGKPLDDSPDIEAIELALSHLGAARELYSPAPDPLLSPRIDRFLGDALDAAGMPDEAEKAYERALAVLRPAFSPHDCTEVGAALGALRSAKGDWAGAANAYRDAIEASESRFYSRLSTESRDRDIRSIGQLHRWAAFALAKVSQVEDAALVLENGRAREFRRRLELESRAEALARLPDVTADAYSSALADVAASPIGETGEAAAAHLQRVLDEIRQHEGLCDFAMGSTLVDLGAAVSRGWPLVYVNPTPAGTVLIAVATDGSGVGIEAEILDFPTSRDVYYRMMIGAAAHDQEAEATSYLLGISGEGDGDETQFQDAIDDVVNWLGETVAKPIDGILQRLRADGCTLIPCGPIALAPLHASQWDSGARKRALVDRLPVRYAPSAAVQSVARKRARTIGFSSDDGDFLVVENPTGDLDAAGPEVVEVLQRIPPTFRVIRAEGADATAEFVADNVPSASMIHFACHANGGMFEASEAGLHLANGWLSTGTLAGIEGMAARLVTVSACQAAIAQLEAVDEAVSIGTALLSAGAAGVIATQWPVHDLGAAMLATKFYEELFREDVVSPSEALRRAQLWMKDSTIEDVQGFLAGHPALQDEYRRRNEEGAPGPPLALESLSHPDYWAAFIAVGV